MRRYFKNIVPIVLSGLALFFTGAVNVNSSVPGIDGRLISITDPEKLVQADSAFKNLLYADALKLYKEEIANDPAAATAETYLKAAMSAFNLDDFGTAEKYFTEASISSKSMTDFIEYHLGLAAYSQKKTTAASKHFANVQNVNNSSLKEQAQFYTAKIHYESGKFKSAEVALLNIKNTRALTAKTNEYNFMLAESFIRNNQHNKGLDTIYKILDSRRPGKFGLKAAEYLAKYRKDRKEQLSDRETILSAYVYRTNSNRKKTVELIDSFFNRFQTSKYMGRAHFERGQYRYSRRRYTDSLGEFEKAFKLLKDPGKIRESRLLLARAKLNKGDRTGAIAEYDKFVRSYPTDNKSSEAYWMIGRTYERAGNISKAITAYKNAAKKSRRRDYLDRSAFRAGFLMYSNKQQTNAAKYFSELIKKYPDSELSFQSAYWKAKSFERLGKKDEAMAVYTNLANKKARSYYIIKAKEKIGDLNVEFTNNSNRDLSVELPGNMKEITEIGKIFGEPWGTKLLDKYRRGYRKEFESAVDLRNAYVEIARYRDAVSVTDFIYNRYYKNTTERDIFEALYPMYFKEMVQSVPRMKRVDDYLIFSVIRRESLFEFDAISSAGAIGLMQLMPNTARLLAKSAGIKGLKPDKVYLPYNNLRLGVQNIFELSQRFKRNKALMLSAYNAGDGPTRKWMKRYGTKDMDEFVENIEYGETQTFVKEVLKNYFYYTQLYPGLDN